MSENTKTPNAFVQQPQGSPIGPDCDNSYMVGNREPTIAERKARFNSMPIEEKLQALFDHATATNEMVNALRRQLDDVNNQNFVLRRQFEAHQHGPTGTCLVQPKTALY